MDGSGNRSDGVSGSLSLVVHRCCKAVPMHANVVSSVCIVAVAVIVAAPMFINVM